MTMINMMLMPVATLCDIDWNSLDIGRVHAFYESVGRPVEHRVLLCEPANPAQRQEWCRQCAADYKAMLGRDCPTCGG